MGQYDITIKTVGASPWICFNLVTPVSWCIMRNHYDASMQHDDLSWCIMMNQYDISWRVIMKHDEDSSWCIMAHHDASSRWLIIIITMHHDESTWCIMMRDSLAGCLVATSSLLPCQATGPRPRFWHISGRGPRYMGMVHGLRWNGCPRQLTKASIFLAQGM